MASPIRAIIVDDEPSCIQNLHYYLNTYCPDIDVTATTDHPEEAIALMNKGDFEVAFLDVELFDRNIFAVLEAVPNRLFKIIFVTAYERYALPALRAAAFDYILKPLERDEIIRCYNKLLDARPANELAPVAKQAIRLRQGERYYLIDPTNVIYASASGFYTDIHFEHKKEYRCVKLSKPIQNVCEDPQYQQLFRTHRSYAVNTSRITGVRRDGSLLLLEMPDGRSIPVSKRRTKLFLSFYRA